MELWTRSLDLSQPRNWVAGEKSFAYLLAESLLGRAIAVLALFLVWPLCAAVAVAIKLDSNGPALFKHLRIGRDGRRFWMYKFRTMCPDAEEKYDDVCHLNEEETGLIIRIKDDPRVTRLGRILRSTSLDELPQLINVVKGDMALVGPRPPSPCEVERYDARQMQRLLSTPGLTGLWQVSGRKNLTFDQMVDLDIEYARRRGILLDISILFRTFTAVFCKEGAR